MSKLLGGIVFLATFLCVSVAYATTPTVTAINPDPIDTGGQAGVRITGTNFASGATVSVNGNAATGIVVNSGERITATFPANTSGTYDVYVTVGGNTSAQNIPNDQVTYNPIGWTASQAFPATDVNSQSMGGTELREFAALNSYTSTAALYATTGMLNAPTIAPGGQILVLNAAPAKGGAWQVEQNLNDFCQGTGSLGMSHRYCFPTMDSMVTTHFTIDNALNSVDTDILTVGPITDGTTSSCSSGSNEPAYSFSMNNTSGDTGGNGGTHWYGTNIACDTGHEIRSYSWVGHTDSVTLHQYIFAGEDGTGIFEGELNSSQGAGHDPIVWNTTAAEFLNSSYSYDACDHTPGRPMGFAELTGADGITRSYASLCFTVYVRIDGTTPTVGTCGANAAQMVVVNGNCVARWQPYWNAVNVNNLDGGNSGNGLRGLTALSEETAPQDMIVGYEGSTSNNVSEPPATGTVAPPDQGIWKIPALCESDTGLCGGVTTCGDFLSTTTGLVSLTNTSCATNEYQWYTELNSLASIHPGPTTGTGHGTAVDTYNEFTRFYNNSGVAERFVPFTTMVAGTLTPPSGSGYSYMVEQQTGYPRWADGAYLVRASGGSYSLIVEPNSMFTTPQEGSRTEHPSPFKSECAFINGNYSHCAVYSGGYDVQATPNNTFQWCAAGSACPTNNNRTLVGVPNPTTANSNTAWIARHGP